MELGVLVIDSHGDVFPQRQVVGAAVVQQSEQVGDARRIGKFDNVAIAVEEILEDAEVEHVDSHLGMVSMPMRVLRVLRRVGFGIVAVTVVLMLAVQAQNWVLRLRAERLHREIVALQIHPGTFADVERMQRKWGRFGHWDGECTERHCIYEIRLRSWFQDRLDDVGISQTGGPETDRAYRWVDLARRFYYWAGGRADRVGAGVRIHNDRMWGAGFGFGTAAYPGTGRNAGNLYVVFADVELSSRLLNSWDPASNPGILGRGFRTDYELQCLGCQQVHTSVTLQTDPGVTERLNRFNFSCMTQWNACKHPVDLAPELWKQAVLVREGDLRPQSNQEEEVRDELYCQVSPTVLAREANDILLVQVLAARPTDDAENGQTVSVEVLEPVKNGHRYRTSNRMVFEVPPHAVREDAETKRLRLEVGKEYFFLYYQASPKGVFFAKPYLDPCHALANNDANAAAVQAGTLLDPSTGETYDYQNDPGNDP